MGVFPRLGPFLGEMRRRRVWRTAIGYAAFVFVALQVGEIVLPAFGAPDWGLRLLVTACFLGFPLVLALAWAFDITPRGIQKTEREAGHGGSEEITGSALPRLALLAVTLATVGGVGWWTVQDALSAEDTLPSPASDGNAVAASLEAPPLQIRSLAVLPLDDFSEEEGGEYVTAGFHEELISQLSQIGAARVISRTSVVQYDRSGKTMPTVAEELGVEGVVEGSVFRDGNRVRITVQLIHGPTDQHLWANSYDGTMEDAIGLQRTVAQAIAKEIRAELFPEDETDTPEVRVAANPEVQEEYLKGRYYLGRATPEALDSAADHYRAALREDSSFAPAYAGLAAVNFLMGFQSEDSLTGDPRTGPEVAEPLEKAFVLDEDSREARAVLLAIEGFLGQLPEDLFPEGIKIVGDSLGSLDAELALTGTEFGRQIQRVVSVHGPRGPSRPSTPQRLAEARRLQAGAHLQEAEAVVRKTLEDAPESHEAWDALEQVMTFKGDYQAVAEAREARLERNPDWHEGQASLRELEQRLAGQGEEGFWTWRLQELQDRQATGDSVSHVHVARAYAGLDRMEEALQELENALARGDRNLLSLWSDPAWDTVRTHPRFRQILSEIRRARREEGLLLPE